MKRRALLQFAAGSLLAAGQMRANAQGATQKTMATDIKKLDKNMATQAADDGLAWYDVREWGVEGKGWNETESYFDRLPAKAKGVVRQPVWDLSHHSAGMCFFFETDATDISARWTLRSNALAMPHMPATGVSGLDLYAVDEKGRYHWVSVGRPETAPQVQTKLVGGLLPGRRRYCTYLPLYNGVTAVQIGVAPGTVFQPVPPRQEAPILFYGTSIVHGGCASRPGMCHPAILGRRLKRPVINLGFSGNGRMEPEVAALLAELDPCVYVIDCLPNMNPDEINRNAEPLVRTLRKAHARTPIVLVEDRTYANAAFLPGQRHSNDANRAAFRAVYERLKHDGVKGLIYVPGEHLLGDDGEGTVDSSHPTDLGFMRMSDALEPVLRSLC